MSNKHFTILDVFRKDGVSLMPATDDEWLDIPTRGDVARFLIKDANGHRRLVNVINRKDDGSNFRIVSDYGDVDEWWYMFIIEDVPHFLVVSWSTGDRYAETRIGCGKDNCVRLYTEPCRIKAADIRGSKTAWEIVESLLSVNGGYSFWDLEQDLTRELARDGYDFDSFSEPDKKLLVDVFRAMIKRVLCDDAD